MASTVLKSNQVTFVDTTDARKLEVYIASNLPTVQIYNVNNKTYSPDWSSGEKLKLTASIFLDSREITANSQTIRRWYRQIGTNTKTQLAETGASLTISTNEMSGDAAIITYYCEAEYQGIVASTQIIFTRTDTGLNGFNGKDAYSVIAQYSEDGLSSWTETLNAAIHKYIRFSYDGGTNWTVPIKIAGQDGTSVTIKGTAYHSSKLTDTDIGKEIELFSDVNASILIDTTNLNTGDGYIVDGYLCVYNKSDNNKFICTGTIQGPTGRDGQSSYLFVRYAEDSTGKGMDESPSDQRKWIGTYVSDTNIPPTANQFTWRKFVGEDGKDAKAIVLNGSSQIFKVNGSTTAPETITVTAQAINTTITAWTYSVDGGKTFTSTRPSGVAISGNVITITGLTLSSESVVIKATDGTYSDTYTVYKISNGATGTPASIAFLTNENISFSANSSGEIKATTFETSVVAYTGTNKVTPVIDTPTGLPTGMTLNSSTTLSNEIVLSFSIADNSTLGEATNTGGTITIPITSPVSTNLKLIWSKINAGAKGVDGVGINSITITYGQSDSPSTQPTSWGKDIPSVPEGKYLWTRTITDYTDSSKEDAVVFTYVKQGAKGETGTAGTSVTVSSIQYQEGGSATNVPIGTWKDTVVSVAEGNYLWTKTEFSDGKTAYGVAKQGASGRGISKVTEYYLATTSSSGVTTSTSGWTTAIQTINSSNRYLWNYEVITYTDNTTSLTTPILIGVFGSTGSTGKGIKSITEYYLATTESSGITTSTAGWTTTMQTLTSTNKYLWNYELITYTDDTTSTINPVIIGAYGDMGLAGAPGADSVTFQVYSGSGYALSANTPIITLQTFAYIGDIEITAGATYQWYRYGDTDWEAISGAINSYFSVSRDNVLFSNSYMCKMQFNETEYVDVVTIDDKNDVNKVFTIKPSNYVAGDIWIVGADYAPAGVEVGTLLKAEHTNTTYEDADWVTSLKYDSKIDELQSNIETYNQYFSFDSAEGLKISAKNDDGTPSQFSTSLTNERLSFNYGDEAIAYIDGTKMNIKEAKIESPLTVTGKYSGSTMLQAPVINIGNFSIIVESNGSLSIVANV